MVQVQKSLELEHSTGVGDSVQVEGESPEAVERVKKMGMESKAGPTWQRSSQIEFRIYLKSTEKW